MTTLPMAHLPLAYKSDSIYLDPKLESRPPLLALSQQRGPSSNQESGELFFCLACKFVAHVLIIGWHISKHLMRIFSVHISQAR
jgi:hypothetical protein